MKKTAKVFLIIAAIIGLFLLYVQLTYQQEFEAPTIRIHTKNDSASVARGKYIVSGPAHCMDCHTNKYGELAGGKALETPFGTFYTRNITSDKETGIGRYSDEQLAQVIRYGISPQKTAMAPFMTYNSLSDDDIAAVISFLRSTKPIKHRVPDRDLNILGKVIARFMLKPIIPTVQPPKTVKKDTTTAYGRYLAISIAQCNGCHTKRSATGEFEGAQFSGGYVMEERNGTFTTPNLTPDKETGRIYQWSEQLFINRFRAGNVLGISPMPWKYYQNLTDDDLKAIFKFLKTLPPTKNKVESTFIVKNTQK